MSRHKARLRNGIPASKWVIGNGGAIGGTLNRGIGVLKDKDRAILLAGCSSATGQYYVSLDGKKWQTRTMPLDVGNTEYIDDVAVDIHGNILVLLGNKIIKSTDGLFWKIIELPDIGDSWTSISYAINGNTFIIVSSINKTARSTNGGNTWTLGGDLPTSQFWKKVESNGQSFVAVGYDLLGSQESDIAAVSFDFGLTWGQITMPSAQQWTHVSYKNAYPLSPGNVGAWHAISLGVTFAELDDPDAVNGPGSNLPSWQEWTEYNVSENRAWIDQVHTYNARIIINGFSKYYYLNNVLMEFPENGNWSSIDYIGDYYSSPTIFAAKNSGTIAKSSDSGETWTLKNLNLSTSVYSLEYKQKYAGEYMYT